MPVYVSDPDSAPVTYTYSGYSATATVTGSVDLEQDIGVWTVDYSQEIILDNYDDPSTIKETATFVVHIYSCSVVPIEVTAPQGLNLE